MRTPCSSAQYYCSTQTYIRIHFSEYKTYLINGEADAQVLHTHLLLLASVLLHEGNETRALAVTIVILVQVYLKLGVVGEGGEVTTPSSLGTKPAAGLDYRVPTLGWVGRVI